MSEKKIDRLMDHNYDGIQEMDNDLPGWWVGLFYICIVFGVIYLLGYHIFPTWNLQYKEYIAEMGLDKKGSAKPVDEEIKIARLTDAADLEKGKKTFATNCASCHGPEGQGLIGPNFTDKYWIHGGAIENIVNTIKVGVAEKGMPAWNSLLKPKQVLEVASFIMSLQGTNPPNQKAAEGKEE